MCRKTLIVSMAVVAIMLSAHQTMLAAEAEAPTTSAKPGAIGPRADKLLSGMCQAVGSADAFTFHAEIMFDRAFRTGIKIQYAAAMNFAVQRPDELAVDFQSDLGAKGLWYSGGTLTVLDSPHKAYATLAVPSIIDAMLERVVQEQNLTIPLSDLAASDPCKLIRKEAVYGGYVGVGDVNGQDCDHLALSSAHTDLQLWLARSGKPVPQKVVITYRSLPGAPEYIAFLSDWKFPKQIAPSRFRPVLPKDAQRIEFLKVKEALKP